MHHRSVEQTYLKASTSIGAKKPCRRPNGASSNLITGLGVRRKARVGGSLVNLMVQICLFFAQSDRQAGPWGATTDLRTHFGGSTLLSALWATREVGYVGAKFATRAVLADSRKRRAERGTARSLGHIVGRREAGVPSRSHTGYGAANASGGLTVLNIRGVRCEVAGHRHQA